MSPITWTREELSSELRPLNGRFWRTVEAQHFKSTMKLVDSQADQEILEEEIEGLKPSIPSECRHLEYLLFTPFRYNARYPSGSRFRRAGLSKGVLYCCASPATAMAEMIFLRLLFFAEAPSVPLAGNPAEYTTFSVTLSTRLSLDLTAPPLDRDAAIWHALADYGPCQAFADVARECSAEVIQYESVRDPDRRMNFAVLTPQAIVSPAKLEMQSWHLQFQRKVVWAKCEAPSQSLTFELAHFLRDPRLAGRT